MNRNRAPRMQAERKPLRIFVLTPPLAKSGGVGTLFQYAKMSFSENVHVNFVDTRGFHRNPVFSIFPLLGAMMKLSIARMQKSVDIVHVNLGARGSTLRKSVLILFSSRILRLPCITQLHSSSFDIFFEESRRVFKRAIIYALNHSTKILVLGEKWKKYMLSIGCSSSIVETFQMGVPRLISDDSIPTLTNSTSNEPLTLLFAGAMGERKGLPSLLKALQLDECPKVKLIVAGSGDFANWQFVTREAGLSASVAVVGLVSVERVHELLNLSDILILPSMAEGLPVSVLEALAAAKIVACCDVGAIGEFIEDERNGFLIQEPTPQEICKTLERIATFRIQPDFKVVQHNAYKLWYEKFDSAKTTKYLEEIWQCSVS